MALDVRRHEFAPGTGKCLVCGEYDVIGQESRCIDQHIALDLETTCPKCHKPLNQHVSGEGEVDTLCPSDNYQQQSTKTFLHTVCAVCGHPMYEHAFNYDEALCP